MTLIIRDIFYTLRARIKEKRRFIQVLLGPRQVGKTTLVNQLADDIEIPVYYVSADLAALEAGTWIKSQWDIARVNTGNGSGVLVIDEIQKIPNWSNQVKTLWEEDTRLSIDLKVILLGSSPWLMQKGLTESLAGRFEIIPVTHWSYGEMNKAFNLSLDEYIYFGGYPGAASLIDRSNSDRWLNYINDSLIETTISKDILLMTQVNKPALLRQLFQLGCLYSGQILSYTKMLGQLHDAGNTTTLAHYLELLSGAGLIANIQKYSSKVVRQRTSSPKLQVMNTALMSAQIGVPFNELRQDRSVWGRLVESTVGAYLLNSARGKNIKIYYWRDGNDEVDFILKTPTYTTAIEVKSGVIKQRPSGLNEFNKQYKPNKIVVIGEKGVDLKTFLLTPIEVWTSD